MQYPEPGIVARSGAWIVAMTRGLAMTANRSRGGAATEIALKAKVAPANRDAAAAVGDAEGGADAAEGIETTHRAATALRGGSKTGLRR
jgi:hypothetical protein